jgi:hypothetical protein
MNVTVDHQLLAIAWPSGAESRSVDIVGERKSRRR